MVFCRDAAKMIVKHQSFPAPSFGDEKFNFDDSLKQSSVTSNAVENSHTDPSDSSPVSISCTTQVALVHPYNSSDVYSGKSVLYETGQQPYIPGHSSHYHSPEHLPLPAGPYPETTNSGNRLLCNIDAEPRAIQQQYTNCSGSTSNTIDHPARPYAHYSPQPGSVPYSHQYSIATNPHLQTDQYFQQIPTQGCCPPQVGYHSSLPSHYNNSYSHNPQFPPQNFVDIPDITENNSVYYQHNHSAGYTPRTSYIPMAQREPILSTMDEAVGRRATDVAGSPVNNSDDSDDNLPLTKIVRGKVTKRKRGGKGGGTRGGVDTSPTGKAGEGKKTRTPKKRRKKDPNEPVKPVSAYAMFFRDTQAAIKSQSPKATFGDVSKIVASMWDGLDEQAKSDYKVKTEIAKKEYLQKLAAYRASLVSQGADGIGANDAPPQVSPERNIPSTSAETNPPTFQTGDSFEGEHYSKPEESQSQTYVPAVDTTSPENHDQDHHTEEERSEEAAENGDTEDVQGDQERNDDMEQSESTTETTAQNEEVKGNTEIEQINGTSHVEDPSVINTNVFYGKSEQTSPSVSMNGCTRAGCDNEAVDSPQWDSEYCSNQCVVEHCRDVFTAWVASRSGFASVN